MALTQRIAAATRALLGISGYQAAAPMSSGLDLDSAAVNSVRAALGGQLQPLPVTRSRWYLADLETAQQRADSGDLQLAAQLWRSSKRDGTIAGLRKTLSAGLVSLPKRFRGNEEMVADLRADNGTRSKFDEMFPAAELAKLADDGVGPGVGVGILQDVPGRDFPVMLRLEPEYLQYRWNEDRWYYRSVAGPLAITPGDGRWVLHVPGGRFAPWNDGSWQPVGRSFISKDHAILYRQNYAAKLANPARIAKAPLAATEKQREGFLQTLMQWGINQVFELPPGWDAALLESNGRGTDVFKDEIATADLETMIALAGQVVTVTGGSGFANADIHRTIRADIIRMHADALAHTLNTQAIPPWEIAHYGIDSLAETVRVEWDTAPPADRKTEAEALKGVGDAIIGLAAALEAQGQKLNVNELVSRFGIPVIGQETPAVPEPQGKAA
jgi:hypothetical protein